MKGMEEPETKSPIEMRFGRDLSWQWLTVMTASLGFPVVFLILMPTGLQLAGASSWLGYLIGGVIFALIALCLGELARHQEDSLSGLYGMMVDDRNTPLPFLVGWMLILGSIALAGLAAQTFSTHVLPLLTPAVASTAIVQSAVMAIALILATLGNVMGTSRSRQMQGMIGGVLISLLLVTCLRSIPEWHIVNLTPWALPSAGHAARFLGVLAPGLIGLELALQARNEVRQPQRRLLRILLFATALIFGLSSLIFVSAVGILGADGLRASSLPLTSFAAAAFGPPAGVLMQVVAGLALLTTTATILLLTSRQVHALTRDGYLPRLTLETGLVRAGRIHLWTILIGLSAFAITFCPARWLAPISGACFLIAVGAGCLRSVLVQERSQGRRFPLHPLLPSLAAAAIVLLLVVIDPLGPATGAAWAAAGGIIYLAYGRRGHIAAQQGRQVFHAREKDDNGRPDFSILVPVIGGEVSRLQMQIATSLARREEGEVVPLRMVILTEQMTRAEGQRLAREESQLFQWSMPSENDEQIVYRPITRLGRDVARGILDTAVEEECDLILLGWRGQMSEGEYRMGSVVDEVVRSAPCDVAVVKGRENEGLRRILVPTAGGPHAPLAARIGLQLATDHDAHVTMLNVVSKDASDEERAAAQERIDATIADLPHAERAESRIIEGDSDIVESILGETREGYDLTLLGASNMGLVDRLIFGSVPERIARDASTSVIMTKKFGGPARYWSFRAWRTLDRLFPDLRAEEQVDLYRRLRSDARPGINYATLIVLSSIIATLGLLQNSAAVIIGAMLVAPLMSPILGISMAIVRADFRLLSLAVETTIKGILSAVAVAIMLTLIVPGDSAGSEILARTHPTILDMIVALASGAAGAYALGRKEVAAALPGVAIAAALVPPLAVVGIGLASGNSTVAGGAMLLFVTNLIAISVAGAVIFLLLGVRPRRERDHRLRHGLAISFLLLAFISIPLGVILADSLHGQRQEDLITETVEWQLEAWSANAGVVEMTIDRTRDETLIDLTIQCDEEIDEAQITALGEAIQRRLGGATRMQVTIVPVDCYNLSL